MKNVYNFRDNECLLLKQSTQALFSYLKSHCVDNYCYTNRMHQHST